MSDPNRATDRGGLQPCLRPIGSWSEPVSDIGDRGNEGAVGRQGCPPGLSQLRLARYI